jgi:hypothetical protein
MFAALDAAVVAIENLGSVLVRHRQASFPLVAPGVAARRAEMLAG